MSSKKSSREARYAKACKVNGILPVAPDIDWDGHAFLADKRLMAAEFAENAEAQQQMMGWKVLRIGGSCHWQSIFNLLSGRPWTSLQKLEIWGNLQGDRTFGVAALQALFNSAKKLVSFQSKHAADLRNLLRHAHEPVTESPAKFARGGAGGAPANFSFENTVKPDNVDAFPNNMPRLSGHVNMPPRDGPFIDLAALASDGTSPYKLEKVLPLLAARKSSEMLHAREVNENRLLNGTQQALGVRDSQKEKILMNVANVMTTTGK